MLFGNTSLHQDVVLHDVALPRDVLEAFGGPRHGLEAGGGGSARLRGR
jgi:ribulose-bisphosphate carboxylase large chain